MLCAHEIYPYCYLRGSRSTSTESIASSFTESGFFTAEPKKFAMKKLLPCLDRYTERNQSSKKAEHALVTIEQRHQQGVDPALRLWLSNKLPEKDAVAVLDKFIETNPDDVVDVNSYLEKTFRNYANERLATSGARDGGSNVGGGGKEYHSTEYMSQVQ